MPREPTRYARLRSSCHALGRTRASRLAQTPPQCRSESSQNSARDCAASSRGNHPAPLFPAHSVQAVSEQSPVFRRLLHHRRRRLGNGRNNRLRLLLRGRQRARTTPLPPSDLAEARASRVLRVFRQHAAAVLISLGGLLDLAAPLLRFDDDLLPACTIRIVAIFEFESSRLLTGSRSCRPRCAPRAGRLLRRRQSTDRPPGIAVRQTGRWS